MNKKILNPSLIILGIVLLIPSIYNGIFLTLAIIGPLMISYGILNYTKLRIIVKIIGTIILSIIIGISYIYIAYYWFAI